MEDKLVRPADDDLHRAVLVSAIDGQIAQPFQHLLTRMAKVVIRPHAVSRTILMV